MTSRFLTILLLAGFAAFFGACTGDQSAIDPTQPRCVDSSQSFCLVSCSLGCSVAGVCQVTEIAENQTVVLNFSEDIDPTSVTAASVSLRTVNGEAPTGQFRIDGSSLVFTPEVRQVGGQTLFGFRPAESYILSLPGNLPDSLRSASGDLLSTSVVCTLSATLGLVDLDGQPPAATMIAPATATGVPKGSPIVLQFSELINTSRFRGGNTLTTPIEYWIYTTKEIPGTEVLQCDLSDRVTRELVSGVPTPSVIVVDGVPITEISLQPTVELPSKSCVQVIVTEGVVDLAGTPAERQEFTFVVEAGQIGPVSLKETFASDQRMDRVASGGTWAAGVATPATLGGRGIHGSFVPSNGLAEQSTYFVWDTDEQTLPEGSTLFGDQMPEAYTVTGGQFEFTDFIVPKDTTVVFRGSNPAVIRARGQVRIEGEVLLDGAIPAFLSFNPEAAIDETTIPPQWLPTEGQEPSPGGAGGGAGGQGGDGCPGTGLSADYSGRPGEDLSVPAGSGYAGLGADTGGKGGPLFPADGLHASVTFNVFSSLCGQLAGGGGGGGFLVAGEPGEAIQSYTGVQTDLGPDSVPGVALPFQAPPSGVSSLDHYLVGGAGGGGGGSQPLFMTTQDISSDLKPWNAGQAGSGGGGALAIRAGDSLVTTEESKISARGGGGINMNSDIVTLILNLPSPGGAGSGGSVLLQAMNADLARLAGSIDVSGGEENVMVKKTFTANPAESVGGAGGHGFARVEADGVGPTDIGTIVGPDQIGPDNFGDLEDGDDYTGFSSLWRSTRQVFEPAWSHYRMVARINGEVVVFSDHPDEFNPADRDDLPVRVYLQGAPVSSATSELVGEPTIWVDYVNPDAGESIGSAPDGNGQPVKTTGFRFMLMFNRSVETDVVIEEFEVVFEA